MRNVHRGSRRGFFQERGSRHRSLARLIAGLAQLTATLPLLTATLALLGTLAACAGPVAVQVPDPPKEARAACARLAPLLPVQLIGKPRREARPESDLTTAWGDPPIVSRCGVPRPAAYSPTAEVVTVNGVDWLPERRTQSSPPEYVFTTVGRIADLEVRVPSAYAPELNPLTELSSAVEQALPKQAR